MGRAGKLCTLQIESQEDQFDMVPLNVVILRQDGGPFEEEP